MNRPDGVQVARDVTYEQCKALCGLRSTCKMVDYNIRERTCWEHTTDGEKYNTMRTFKVKVDRG